MPDIVKGNYNYAEWKMKQGVDKTTNCTQVMQVLEESHPDSRLKNVGDTDNEKTNDGQSDDCDFHDASMLTPVFLA